MSTNYNFKDNITVDNNKYLRWLDVTGTSRVDAIVLDNLNRLKINSQSGDLIFDTTAKNVFNSGNVQINQKLSIGGVSSGVYDLTLKKDAWIGVDVSDSYLGLSGSNGVTTGSRILLYGNETNGQLRLHAGNVTTGHINFYTGNDLCRYQVSADGTATFTPDGFNTRVTISDTASTFSNSVSISNTTNSTNSSTGALVISGGVGIGGDIYLQGSLNSDNTLSFSNLQPSVSYTSGSLVTLGGIGISATANSTSVTSGGAISIAGGASIAKDLFVGGKMVILDSTVATSSLNASVVLYGGLGMNDGVYSRSDISPQFRMAPMTNNNDTGICFFSRNDFTSSTNTDSSWTIGQTRGNFNIRNSQAGSTIFCTFAGNVGINNVGPSYRLDVNGNTRVTGELLVTRTVTSSSDIRLKTNITEFKKADEKMLDKIDNIRTIKYNYKRSHDDERSQGPQDEGPQHETQTTPQSYIGFIAQDFVDDFPELLRKTPDDYYSLDYQKMSVVLLECVKELKDEINSLRKDIPKKRKYTRKTKQE